MAEDDDSNVDRAEHGELMSLLEETTFSLEEGSDVENVSYCRGASWAR